MGLCSEVIEKFPPLRPAIIQKLINTLSSIRSGKVFRGVLWILGEYTEEESIEGAFMEVRAVIGDVPIGASEQLVLDEAGADTYADEETKEKGSNRPRVLADGTYATETAFTSTLNARMEAVKASVKPPLRCEWP